MDGLEWVIIGAVAIVIIMWGPAKIPEFAKALGRAKGEYHKAQKEFDNAANMPMTSNVATSQPYNTNTAATGRAKEATLLETAQSLGIDTAGKTQQQIGEEISMKAKLLSAN